MNKLSVLMVAGCALLAGCHAPATSYRPQSAQENLTLGKVQMEIHKGMTQSEVLQALGSPNLVTRDKDGLETWAYDKASTEVISTRNSAFGTVLVLSGQTSQSAAKVSQRTLTLILKFRDAVLQEFSYNATSF